MYETVRIVKGYEVTRMIGTRGFYTVRLDARRSVNFRTIKAAVEYINKNL